MMRRYPFDRTRFFARRFLGPATIGLGLALLGEATGAPAQPEEAPMRTVVEINAESVGLWRIVNDGVMGGISRSRMSYEDAAAVFEGTVSLENNGGFASVRASLARTDLSDWDGIELRVEGAGARFQLRLRTDGGWDGVAYRAHFEAPSGEVRAVRIPFSAFRPNWRGRMLTNVEPLDPARIEQIGFLIADGHEGPFRLRVERIDAYREVAAADSDSR